jgi:UDP-N-acetylmuramyl pentapeptide phosphotransferase/UDP-N-acetylglucosamine-1-phosphate transferase
VCSSKKIGRNSWCSIGSSSAIGMLSNEYLVKLYLFWDAMTRQRSDGALIRLSAAVDPGEDEQAVEQRLLQFAQNHSTSTESVYSGLTMTSAVFFSFITSLFICMALIPPLQLNAGRWRFMDLPGERKVHANPIPRIGGIAFGFAALLSIFFWVPQDPVITPVLVSATIILGFGIWDDRANLNYRTKLVGQLLAIFVVVIFGHIHFEQIPFFYDEEAPLWLTVPLTVVFLVGASNAVNLSDGLDGLAGGLAFLSFAGIAYLAYLSHDTTVLVLAAGFLGGLLGFLRYNTYPARIFMGDAGSQLLGFSMGVLVLLMSDPARAPFPVTVGLLVLGLPFLDTIAVMGQRLAKGRSPFIGDRNHVHHKLLALGLSHYEAVIVIYGIQAVMVGLAYLLRWQSDALICTMYGAFALAMFALFVATERRRPSVVGNVIERPGPLRHQTGPGRIVAQRYGAAVSGGRGAVVFDRECLLAGTCPDGCRIRRHQSLCGGHGRFLVHAQYRSHFVRGGCMSAAPFSCTWASNRAFRRSGPSMSRRIRSWP